MCEIGTSRLQSKPTLYLGLRIMKSPDTSPLFTTHHLLPEVSRMRWWHFNELYRLNYYLLWGQMLLISTQVYIIYMYVFLDTVDLSFLSPQFYYFLLFVLWCHLRTKVMDQNLTVWGTVQRKNKKMVLAQGVYNLSIRQEAYICRKTYGRTEENNETLFVSMTDRDLSTTVT